MNEKINITKMDGTKIAGDLVCFIENVKTGKRYAYYTLNEMVGTGANSTVKIYVSKLQQNNPLLDTPITDGDWDTLKGYMGDALRGTSNPDIKYLQLGELGDLISVSERAIAMPTSYDYINKQRGMYAQAVATQTTAPAPTTNVTPEVTSTPQPTPEVVAQPAPEPTIAPAPTAPVMDETPAPAQEPVQPEPSIEEVPSAVMPTPEVANAPKVDAQNNASADNAKLKPIDISTIEQRYSEMIDAINELKAKEIEAAKRYNATIELSTMHNEQHANYVKSEQSKEAVPTVAPEVTSAPQPAPEVVAQPASNPAPIPSMPNSIPEPTPVTPVVPEPAPAMSASELETNWFDMPENR